MAEGNSIPQRLEVICLGEDLAYHIYLLCNKKLPESERFGLWSQMTRCAVSIPSNIAEGQQRKDKDFIRFVRMARGSLKELEVQMNICIKIGYFKPEDLLVISSLANRIGAMTHKLITKINSDAESECRGD